MFNKKVGLTIVPTLTTSIYSFCIVVSGGGGGVREQGKKTGEEKEKKVPKYGFELADANSKCLSDQPTNQHRDTY